MIIERTGATAEYYEEIVEELFDGFLGDAQFCDLSFEIDSELNCINNALDQIMLFFKENDFEFSCEDGDTVVQSVREKRYMNRRKNKSRSLLVDTFTALSSNEKIAYMVVSIHSGKTLTISISADRLCESRNWMATDSNRKVVLFYDLFTAKQAGA